MKLPNALAKQPPERRLLILSGLFSLPFLPLLWNLVLFAAQSNLYSYILLIPFVSAYLFRTVAVPLSDESPAWGLAGVLIVLDVLLLGIWFGLSPWNAQTTLTLGSTALLLALWCAALLALGQKGVRQRGGPLAFLVFLIPMTPGMEAGLETFLQHGSAEVANALFHLSGMTFFRDNLSFQLPNIRLMIAPECSGIHSSLVLFIVSLVAGYLFLRSPGKRALLTAFVLPLALMRNGFRVWVLGELCVHIDPSMIDSPIHHQGGPLFFVMSLIPFGALLYMFVRLERKLNASNSMPGRQLKK